MKLILTFFQYKIFFYLKVSDDLKTSVFRETFDHWRELNLTAEFTEIVKKINRYSTLHQGLIITLFK